MTGGLRIAIGSDQAGAAYRTALTEDLAHHPLVQTVITIGDNDYLPYPEVAFAAAQLLTAHVVDRAVLVCHTGIGMAIAGNKVTGIRAATAHDPLSVEHAITHNDAQVLCLGQGVIALDSARQLTRQWLTHTFDPTSRAASKNALITAFEDRQRPRQPAPR
ncbi:D-erythrulose-4-phosphate isomerase 1 [Streptomyces griseocarneus]|nr:D-erythrulose-4-phosphate isomerase 1 [Streptomyces griseocarneus]